MLKRFLLTFIALSFFATTGFSKEELGPLTGQPTENIRQNAKKCATYLLMFGQKEDSVGSIVSSNKSEDFKLAVNKIIDEHGLESLRGSTFYVVGIAMKNTGQTKKEYARLAEELNLKSVDAKIKVLSVPSNLIEKNSASILRNVWERTRYFFPSLGRDFQFPISGEVTTAVLTNMALEVPNAIFLYKILPTPEAYLTIATHLSIIVAMNIYVKTLINWLLRPGTGAVENFLKQIAIAVPFVLNIGLVGHATEIINFYSQYGLSGMWHALPAQISTQFLTLILQATFYTIVINRGFDNWQQRQSVAANSKTARIVSSINKTPILTLDAMALALASANINSPLFSLGFMDFNWGHAALGGLILAGKTPFWINQNFLDPTINWYAKFEEKILNPTRKMLFFR